MEVHGAIAANAVVDTCPTQAVSMRLMIGSSNIPPREGKAMAVTSLIICRVSEDDVVPSTGADPVLLGGSNDDCIDATPSADTPIKLAEDEEKWPSPKKSLVSNCSSTCSVILFSTSSC